MAFYGNFKLVDSFTYKKLRVEIYRAAKGGYCEKCDLDHEPHDRRCSNCGDEISTSTVFLIKVSDKDVGIECSSKDEAEEIAKAWIDDYIDDPDAKDDDPGDALILSDKGKKRRRVENKPPAKEKVSPILAGVRQLGWGKKALGILRGRG